MKNVTYLLGAGASYHALPIVKELSAQIYYWAELIASSDMDIKLKQKQYERFRKYAYYHNSYGTIDTYARSLYLQGNKASELSDLKMFLSQFFLLEQFRSNKPEYLTREERKIEDTGVLGPFNQEFIDHRYLGLFSKLLRPNTDKRLQDNLMFLSWNYDIQLELAYTKLLGMDISSVPDAMKIMNVHPYSNLIKDEANVIHLNGIAGLYRKDDVNSKIYNLYHEMAQRLEVNGLNETVFKNILSDDHGTRIFDNLMTFAWENENNEGYSEAVLFASEKASYTDAMVVIGYSFPVFNHDIDYLILKLTKPSCRIILQDPNIDINSFCERFNISQDRVTKVEAVDQFIIPPELF